MKNPLYKSAPIAIAMVTLFTLSACGGESATDEKSNSESVNIETINEGELLVGYRADDKPLSFIQDGETTGLLIEIMDAIAQEMGMEATYEAKEFASLLPDVRNNLIDIAAFDTLVTEERKEVVNFTDPINFRKAQLLSLKSAELPQVESAGGHVIAITRGSALIPLLEGIAADATIKEFPNVAASTNALSSGGVDGLFTGAAKATELMDEHEDFVGSNLVTSGEAAFPVSKERAELQKAVNDALETIMNNGTYTEIHDKWLETEIPDEMYEAYPGLK